VTAKGHPLIWTIEPEWASAHFAPPEGEWASEGRTTYAEALLYERVRREVAAFKGQIDVWDVINEVVNGPNQARSRGANCVLQLYERYGQHELIRRSFEIARQANPNAKLLINEHRRFAGYDELLDRALDDGVSIDAIGLQSHMLHRYWGIEELSDVCERFAKYGLPIHFTEISIPSGIDLLDVQNHLVSAEELAVARWQESPEHEALQAERAVEWYTTLFSHPSVEAITWWDLTDGDAAQGAPRGLLRADNSKKPAYHALRDLIKGTWWTDRIQARTDAQGRVRLSGYLGDYAVETRALAGEFSLDGASTDPVNVRMEPSIG
jgi:GH35 family endo-1,4-beta-xylanase